MDRFQSETYTATPAHFRNEEAYLDWLANQEPEPVDAAILSACCGEELRYELVDNGIDPETGYHDDGERCVCLGCGQETEPEIRPSARKPAALVARQQADLFAEVA